MYMTGFGFFLEANKQKECLLAVLVLLFAPIAIPTIFGITLASYRHLIYFKHIKNENQT